MLHGVNVCPQSKSLGDKGKQKKHVMLHGVNVVPVIFKKFLVHFVLKRFMCLQLVSLILHVRCLFF